MNQRPEFDRCLEADAFAPVDWDESYWNQQDRVLGCAAALAGTLAVFAVLVAVFGA